MGHVDAARDHLPSRATPPALALADCSRRLSYPERLNAAAELLAGARRRRRARAATGDWSYDELRARADGSRRRSRDGSSRATRVLLHAAEHAGG